MQSKKTILELLHSLDVGGAEILADGLIRALSDFRFVVACLDHKGELGDALERDGYPVVTLGRRPGIDWACVKKLRHVIREHRVDVIHAHQYAPFSYALLARGLHNRPRIVFTEHGRHYPDRRSWKRVLLNRSLLRRDDRVIAVGQSVAKALRENEGIPAGRIEVIYNGIPLEPFLATDATIRAEKRRELGIPDDALVVIHVARLDYLKDHTTAFEAMSLVQKANPNVVYWAVGEGPERPKLEAAIEVRNLTKTCRLLGLRRDIPGLLKAADIFVLSSISEGIPLTVIEAMATGLPIVATDVGGLSELIRDLTSASLVPARDAEAIASSIQNFAARADKKGDFVVRAREVASERYSLHSMNSAYRDRFQKLTV